MAEKNLSPDIVPENQTLWNTERQPAGCPQCRRVFLVKKAQLGTSCPICVQGKLTSQPAYMHPAPPERLAPFKVKNANLKRIYQQFIDGVWLAQEDFNAESLLKRTRPLFWPMWLVDSDISGHWQIEAGFNYQVESSKESFANGQWQSMKHTETRIRWEPRVGKLTHHVDNVVVPGLEEHQKRLQKTGAYQINQAQVFDAQFLGDVPMEVPDLPPENAWPLAKPHVDKTAGEVCTQAIGADHARNFALKADYHNLNWTQMLLPLYTTYYTDDEGQPQIILINGQTGKINGLRLASRKRGLRTAGIIAGVAGFFFLLAIIGLLLTFVFPPAGIAAAILGVLGFVIGIGAIIPAVYPGQWNRKQRTLAITTHQESS